MVRTASGTNDFQERLHLIDDPVTGLRGVIAIHSTALGPAAGGCRFWRYADDGELAGDAIRLARGMSYKNALAGLPFGGGKAVLQRPSGVFDRDAVFGAFADAVAALNGSYITAEDVGTTVADMRRVRQRTRHVAGLDALPGRAGGDPSPWTALGVFLSMKEAARIVLGRDLQGLTVAVQGVGNVGAGLASLLSRAGARLIVADVDRARVDALVAELDVTAMDVDAIMRADADILAPCALGGVLDARAIAELRVGLVCGGANNQLATDADGLALERRGIGYAPDYLVNAGGIINVAAEYLGETTQDVRDRIGLIPDRLRTVLLEARETGQSSHRVADALAERLILAGPKAIAA